MGKHRFTRHSAAAYTEMQAGGVLWVSMNGPLTGGALLYFKARIAAKYGPEICSFVADYRAALIALDGAELDAVLEGEPSMSPITMPAALIAAPHDADLFDGHCARMASRGVLRRLFSEPTSALAWATRHAARFQVR